ncbi:MAG: hypothetical protein KatS3mg057_0013 [Herpetosiphonaceae bacterium]|nr:MAG: hypothetical protein KatS3mg057_0013 [Herpetosiphonaceae bacterium]
MADRRIREFVMNTIDSFAKLQILMLFAERTIRKGSAREIVQRTARDIWSVTEALEDLVAAGILRSQTVDHETIYIYDPSPEQREMIELITKAYNDPLSRDDLYGLIRDLAATSLSQRGYGEALWNIT